LYAAFAGSLIYGAGVLPDQVASHFGLRGEANAWMSRSANLIFFAIAGVVVPLLMLGLGFAIKHLPIQLINLPRLESWLAPERRSEACDFIEGRCIWFASMNLAFLMGLNRLVISANRQSDARLPMPEFTLLISSFFLGTLFWVWRLLR